jgi:hypothetical protein
MVKAVLNDSNAVMNVAQLTQGKDGSTAQCIFNTVNTINTKYLPHKETPMVTFYWPPLMTNADKQETLYMCTCNYKLFAGRYASCPYRYLPVPPVHTTLSPPPPHILTT